MLNSMDSMEYSHWMAFERVHGPVNGEWDREALANIQEQLQMIAYLLGQAHFSSRQRPKGPVEKPERYPRPNDVLRRLSGRSPVDDVDKDEAEWIPLTEDELLEIHIDPTETEEGVE
jgi:hypothetical protein